MTKNRYLEPCPECGQYKYPDSECTKCEVRQEIAMRSNGWKSVESAPKDATWILVHGRRNGYDVALVNCNGEWWSVDGSMIDAPTHWQPLPHPPNRQEVGRDPSMVTVAECDPVAHEMFDETGGFYGFVRIKAEKANLEAYGYKAFPLYRHPAPSIDAGEVERLVDALDKSVAALERSSYWLAEVKDSSQEKRSKYLKEYEADKDSYTAARAALLEYVSKGVDA